MSPRAPRPSAVSAFMVCAVLALFLPMAASASRPTDSDMEAACRGWVARMPVAAEEARPGVGIAGSWEMTRGDTLLARCYPLRPQGYVLVSAWRELRPVQSYSTEASFSRDESEGIAPILQERMLRQVRTLLRAGEGSSGALTSDQERFIRTSEALWQDLWARRSDGPAHGSDGPARASDPPALRSGGLRIDEDGPLLTSAWFQRPPYNNFCPMGDGGRTAAGCGVVALAQILRYHSWPPAGVGSHSYLWNGDQSCGGDVGGGPLSADFSDPYSWALMPDSCTAGCSSAQQDAVAELCYEVAVACEADFGNCGTLTVVSWHQTALEGSFRYVRPSLQARMLYTPESWFELIRREVGGRRPVEYAIPGHAVVVDGWRVADGLDQIHFNSAGGWGGNQRGWWVIDEIPDSPDPSQESILCEIAPRVVVDPSGGGDFSTIQAALDAMGPGVVVELADGIFRGPGNRDLDAHGKQLWIRSASNDPGACVIECEGSPGAPHRGFDLSSGEGRGTIVQGITIRGGYAASGGGIRCRGGASPSLTGVVIEECGAEGLGGGLLAQDASPLLSSCTLRHNAGASGGAIAALSCSLRIARCAVDSNAAVLRGGAVYGLSSQVTIEDCSLVANSAGEEGGAVDGEGSLVHVTSTTAYGNSAPVTGGSLAAGSSTVFNVDHTIVGSSQGGPATSCTGGGVFELSCCDLFGNAGGDWIGCVADQLGLRENIHVDPRFCDPAGGDLTIQMNSPCAEGHNPACGQIGYFPPGCGEGVVFRVRPDGTGDYPTIQAAVEAALDSVVIELSPGTYSGPGNRDIDFAGKPITIRSADGNASSCIIDCRGGANEHHRGFLFRSGEGPGSKLIGVTVMCGNPGAADGGAVTCNDSSPVLSGCVFSQNQGGDIGGGVSCEGDGVVRIDSCLFTGNTASSGAGVGCRAGSVVLTGCTFRDNTAWGAGGGLYGDLAGELAADHCVFRGNTAGIWGGAVFHGFSPASAALTDCEFQENSSDMYGGAIYLDYADAILTRCAFTANGSARGGALSCQASAPVLDNCTLFRNRGSVQASGLNCQNSHPVLRNSIVSFAPAGEAVYGDNNSVLTLSCCDVYGNAGGDWTGRIAGQAGINGNICLDPAFCDTSNTDLFLRVESPCAPYAPPNEECALIGSFPVGCELSAAGEQSGFPAALSLGFRPNPFSGSGWAHCEVPASRAGMRAVLEIFDPAGRRVRTLAPDGLAPGRHVVSWDGADESGRTVPSGVYFLRLQLQGESRRARVIRIH